jgi:hypothetical protein
MSGANRTGDLLVVLRELEEAASKVITGYEELVPNSTLKTRMNHLKKKLDEASKARLGVK